MCVHVLVRVHTYVHIQRPKDNVKELVLSFHQVGSHVSRLESLHLYLLSHLVDPCSSILDINGGQK